MSKKRKRHAIHSGIGDNDDLLVKRPSTEDVTQEFRYASRLRGKKRHDTMVYPELPFEYGISYTGKTLETYNEKEYEYAINAHPEKTISYRVEETKELPVKRLWEAEGCFEATVRRMNMKYAFQWTGEKAVQVRNSVDYAVNWKANVTSKTISDARDFFTSKNGQFIGYGDATTWLKHTSGFVYDYSNIARFSGIIAKNYSSLKHYEAEFDFKTVLATNDQYIGGKDDDIVGLIFKAKDNKNFYMMLWEREERVKGSWRAPDRLDTFNMLTSDEEAWDARIKADNCTSTENISDAHWNDYVNNRGWRKKHRRIYKVTNGVLKRVDTTANSGTLGYDNNVKDLGSGKGWDLNELHSLKVNSIGKRVQISTRDNGVWSKVFDFDTDWEEGSFGLVNVSQAVQFHRITIQEKVTIEGRHPETGWSNNGFVSTITLGSASTYCMSDAKAKAQVLKNSDANIDVNSVSFSSFVGTLRDATKGTITNPITSSTNIVVTAGTHTDGVPITGRVPASGWYEFDGVGQYVHAKNGGDFIKSKDSIAAQSAITITGITGLVYDDPDVTYMKTGVVTSSVSGQLIAHNNNPKDAGQTYSQCYIRCGIVEVTPDHRDYNKGLLIFADIKTVFDEDYKEFFNRPDYINKKETYKLIKPVKKDPPKPPPKEESKGGCVIEDEKNPAPEGPVVQCLNDFDFDGKRLVMWSCEFPLEITTKLFEDRVFAYRGWTTFEPLKKFTPNKWTLYKLIPIEATIDPRYDEVKWAGRTDFDKAPVGTRVLIKTTEWYQAIFPADISNRGIVTTTQQVTASIPPAPEHYWLPSDMNGQKVENRMPDHFEVIHYLLDAYTNHADVVMSFKSNPSLTTDTADRKTESLAHAGRTGMPVVLTAIDTDEVVIQCKEDPRQIPWSSGKYMGYGKVNGKRPFWGNGSGKADMVDVPTEVVFFPDNLVRETLNGPFIDIYDHEFPNYPRVKYRLHTDKKRIDFYSDHTDAYIWYTDWYSNWMESEDSHAATMGVVSEIDTPLILEPTNPLVSSDYNPDNTTIERIEVSSNNPFVKLWIEEDKGPLSGLTGTYYRFPLTSNTHEEKFQVAGDYEEWVQTYEIKPYMDKVSIAIEYKGFTVIEVFLDGNIVPKGNTNGWRVENGSVVLHGTAIQPGMLQVKYSTGSVKNKFTLERDLGTYVEVFVNGRLLDAATYSFDQRVMTINQSELYLYDWVNIQSYELNDLHDPTKRHYLGERKYAQLDFQEDAATSELNPNYDDPYYEGSFCFNWGYERPQGMQVSVAGFEASSVQPMTTSSGDINFTANVDMEILYPVGHPVNTLNSTSEWKTVSCGTPGEWHGPHEEGYTEVTNLANQSGLSFWYNPKDVDKTDYEFQFNAQVRNDTDDDMYGAVFRYDTSTKNFYSFEMDAYISRGSGGTRAKGMAIYKNIFNPSTNTWAGTRLAHLPEGWTYNTNEVNHIRIRMTGNRFIVWVNEVQKFNYVDSTNPIMKGAWGPATESQAKTYFWDLEVQTNRLVTFSLRHSFRQFISITKKRPYILGNNPMMDIEVDAQDMKTKFASVITAYCKEVELSREDITSIEYKITTDTSEYPLYFNEQNKPTLTNLDQSKIHATVEGQYPKTERSIEVDISHPAEPNISDLHPPTESNLNDGFTVTWNGYLYAPTSGIYKFRATANDGFRLWIKGHEIISEWHVTGNPSYFPDYEASIYLEGGKWHSIRANYFDNVGQALVRLHWAQPGRGFQRISPDYLTPYLGYKLFAKVKEATPLPWHPMIHSGYYYHEEREHYLHAEKIVHKKTPNAFHEVTVSPRPQQGSALIVRDNEGNNLRKVTFYDEQWNLTLENKEIFNGSGYAKYYLSYKGIDLSTLKVKINNRTLLNTDYIFNDEESSIEFMQNMKQEDMIDIRYVLLYSYYMNMNADVIDGFVNKDMAQIRLHHNYDALKMKDMEIIYEAARETPFYRASDVTFNPLLTHNHTGFLYIAEASMQAVKDVYVRLSDKTLSNSGMEKVLLTVRVSDMYNNPCPHQDVTILRDGEIIGVKTTDESGEVYLYDVPVPTDNLISTYEVNCSGITQEVLLNYYVDNQPERFYVEMLTPKYSMMAGVNDEVYIKATLRDANWNAVLEDKILQVEIRDTYGHTRTENMTTNSYGQVHINVSGLTEQHGNMMIKVSYDMGFEDTANYVHLKVIGG